MASPFRILFALLLSFSLAHALTPSPGDTVIDRGWGVEFGLRLGSQFGTMRDRDENFYKAIGLGLVQKDGSQENIELSVLAYAADLAVYKTVRPRLRIGFGASALGSSSEPGNANVKDGSKDFMSRQAFTARLRWLPFQLRMPNGALTSIEVEPAFGYAIGTLHRYGLAAAQLDGALDTAPEVAKTYITTANKAVSVDGMHFELLGMLSQRLPSGFLWGLGGGITYTRWDLSGDPLATWTFNGGRYPKSLDDVGICFRGMVGFGD